VSGEKLVRKCYRQQQNCERGGHPNRGFYLREFANGVMHIFHLCVDCGAKVGQDGSLARADHPDWRDYPVAVDGPSSYLHGCTCGWCARDNALSGATEMRALKYQAESAGWVQTASRLRTEREMRLTWHEYERYLKTDKWAKVREQALARFDWRCATCHSEEHLQVHHRTYERVGCEYLTDLTVLCRYCHRALHDLWNQNDRSELIEVEKVMSDHERIVDVLRPPGGGMTYGQLTAELRLSRRKLEECILGLERDGVVEARVGPRGTKFWFVCNAEIDRLEVLPPAAAEAR